MKRNGGLQFWTTAVGWRSFQEHDWLIDRSDHVTQKDIVRSFTQYTKERLFQGQNKTTNNNKNNNKTHQQQE